MEKLDTKIQNHHQEQYQQQGRPIFELKSDIIKAKKRLDDLGKPPQKFEEMITLTNTLRENEYLKNSDAIKSDIIDSYERYTQQMEFLVFNLMEIMDDVKEIVKYTSLLSNKGKHYQNEHDDNEEFKTETASQKVTRSKQATNSKKKNKPNASATKKSAKPRGQQKSTKKPPRR